MKSLAAAVLLIALAAFPSGLHAQCVVGLSGSPTGDIGFAGAQVGEIYDIFVLLDHQGVADAVSYALEIDTLAFTVIANETFGPDGSGINIRTENGENVGLGECATGFGGPIVVAHYQLFLADYGDVIIRVVGNADENAEAPVISSCGAGLTPCEIGSAFYIIGVAVESESFGEVKALYGS